MSWRRRCWPTRWLHYIGLGEHHRDDFAISSPDMVLAGIASVPNAFG